MHLDKSREIKRQNLEMQTISGVGLSWLAGSEPTQQSFKNPCGEILPTSLLYIAHVGSLQRFKRDSP